MQVGLHFWNNLIGICNVCILWTLKLKNQHDCFQISHAGSKLSIIYEKKINKIKLMSNKKYVSGNFLITSKYQIGISKLFPIQIIASFIISVIMHVFMQCINFCLPSNRCRLDCWENNETLTMKYYFPNHMLATKQNIKVIEGLNCIVFKTTDWVTYTLNPNNLLNTS